MLCCRRAQSDTGGKSVETGARVMGGPASGQGLPIFAFLFLNFIHRLHAHRSGIPAGGGGRPRVRGCSQDGGRNRIPRFPARAARLFPLRPGFLSLFRSFLQTCALIRAVGWLSFYRPVLGSSGRAETFVPAFPCGRGSPAHPEGALLPEKEGREETRRPFRRFFSIHLR